MAESSDPTEPLPNPRPKYKRSARNYLIDPAFQLKYTGLLVVIAGVLSVALGVLLARSNEQLRGQMERTVEEGKETVKQGQATVDRGREVINQSNKVNDVVKSQIDTCYPEQDLLAKSFRDAAAEDAKKLLTEQQRLEDDKKSLDSRSTELEAAMVSVHEQQNRIGWIVLGVLLLLVVSIGMAGIIFTHKIAGPMFKMKRLMRQVGEGKLVVRERLRKGDELQHFFESFESMVENMRTRQRAEIEMLSGAIAKLEEGRDPNDEGLIALRSVRAEMQDHLEA